MLDKAPNKKLSDLLDRLGAALTAGEIDKAVECFEDDCYWRDLVAFTWNIKTLEGRDQVRDMLKSQLGRTKPSGWAISAQEDATEADGVLEGWFTFETEVARCRGHIRARSGRIWTLLTAMDELKGHEEPSGVRRPNGHPKPQGNGRSGKPWTQRRDEEAAELGHSRQPYVVIIGGGQGALGLGARLRQLDVPTIIVEKNPRPGDSWRVRYKSLCLHDPVWYDHMPYIPFPPNWPVYSPKDKIGDWLEMYAKVMELNFWGSTLCKSAKYDEKAQEWTVVVEREGKEIVLRPKHLVFATGQASRAVVPNFPGRDTFKGEQQHSSQHPGPDGYVDKKTVVIGSNTSAHDICGALAELGADVTMVQRSPTLVVGIEPLHEIATGVLYSEKAVAAGIDVEKADYMGASMPYKLMGAAQKPLYAKMREQDADFYEKLTGAGFVIDWGDDESGLFMKYMRRGSGYYIDIGASQMIIDGKIKHAYGQVEQLTENGVVLADGKEIPADLVVYATGFSSMNGWVADLVDQETADKVGRVWGLGSGTTNDPGPWEGEPRNMWKPTQQEALWFHGGNLHQSRHNSLFLALQLKARLEGIPTPVYGLQDVHHKK
ncbi:NAD(P)/FAD-dependent oxidoreductase [Arvimicrobium flavum]|uniref:NAD(P)/FAD-dependent oxidoreductase n=1 Tax=Arvimicrobium flavum TaxID=3393320 RepID=UPI00237B58A5|nr:NAD(P)/FAD-dependent oxidoreductase [Mesorhizobium shangrilense]